MLFYKNIKNLPKVFLSFTSLTVEEFEYLLVPFAKAWDEPESNQEKERIRKPGGGRKAILNRHEDRLLFILFYIKTYPIQEVLAYFFGLSQSQANEYIHQCAAVLHRALEKIDVLPERDSEAMKAALEQCEMLEFGLDGTERSRERPKENEKQKEYYSGKKKKHTVKNNLVVDSNSRKVCYLSQTVPGKTHDKKLADDSEMAFPKNSILEQDTGFQGYKPEGVHVSQPKKKPRKKELTVEEEFVNRLISSTRVIVENVICGVKRCRIVKDIFRNKKENFDDLVMEIACGLHNLRVENRSPVETISLVDFYFR